MVIRNAHLRVGLTMVYGYNNIEGAAARKMLNLNRHLFHKLLHLLNLLRTNLGNDLQLLSGSPATIPAVTAALMPFK